MREMTRAFTKAVSQDVKEVRKSGMQDDDVGRLVAHAEGITRERPIKVDTVIGMDETMGFLLL
jgi:hypothetical protein